MADEGLTEARRCAAPGCKGPDGEARHVEGDWRVCRACSGTGYAALAGLPYRYVNLRMALRPSNSAHGEPVSGAGFGTRPPVASAALNAMGDIAHFLVGAEREVRGLLDMTPQPKQIREGVAVVRAVTTLSVHWERTMPLALAPWIVATALKRSRLANRVLGWDRLVHRLPAPCPYCQTVTLIRRDGDSLVRCTLCHRSWVEAEYRHFVRMLVEEVQG